MKFPVRIRHRRQEVVIYGRTPGYRYYKLAYKVGGKRRVQSFSIYSEAKAEAERVVRELDSGSQTLSLTSGQSSDALAAFERLQSLFVSTGRRFSLLAAVSEFSEATSKLNGRALGEVVDGYLSTVASVRRRDVALAVEEFVASREPKTKAQEGKRAQLSAGYVYQTSLWLRDFAKTFPSTAVSDLRKEHLNVFMSKYSKQSAKSRNHYRQTVKMFLRWAVKRDYLIPSHRLLEADGMATEVADVSETEIYSTTELRALLESADAELRPVLALQALGGVRLQECLRFTWQDVWGVSGHVEVSSAKSKTRSRRLCEMGEALRQWLEPYRECSGPVFPKHRDTYHELLSSLLESLKIPAKRNGLRHGFCSYHFAAFGNENSTAAQAGNSPSVVHRHYKGLCTKAEGALWFAVAPSQPAGNILLLPASA